MKKLSGNNKGFTLIELIVVIVVIGILAAIAIPKYQDLSTSAKIAQAQGSLSAIRSAILMYNAQNQGRNPDSTTLNNGSLFQDNQVPANPFVLSAGSAPQPPVRRIAVVTSAPTSLISTTDGYWFVSGSTNNTDGRSGAYADTAAHAAAING